MLQVGKMKYTDAGARGRRARRAVRSTMQIFRWPRRRGTLRGPWWEVLHVHQLPVPSPLLPWSPSNLLHIMSPGPQAMYPSFLPYGGVPQLYHLLQPLTSHHCPLGPMYPNPTPYSRPPTMYPGLTPALLSPAGFFSVPGPGCCAVPLEPRRKECFLALLRFTFSLYSWCCSPVSPQLPPSVRQKYPLFLALGRESPTFDQDQQPPNRLPS